MQGEQLPPARGQDSPTTVPGLDGPHLSNPFLVRLILRPWLDEFIAFLVHTD